MKHSKASLLIKTTSQKTKIAKKIFTGFINSIGVYMHICALSYKSSINKYNDCNFNKNNTLQSKKISFKPNFRGIIIDSFSFDEFQKAAIKCGIISLKNLIKNIKPENVIGSGANSTVYKFDSKLLNNWVLKEDKKIFTVPCKKLFEQTEDVLYGFNMGQEIAKSGSKYRILKRIEGIAHSVPNWSQKISSGSIVNYSESLNFLNSLKKLQNFPQEAFNNYALELKKLEDKGFKQDSINPNNILIDYDKQIIHIIDFFKACDPSHINSSQDLICVLLDFSLFKNFYEQLSLNERKLIIGYSKNIIKKCNIAALNAGLKQDEQIYLNFLSNVDKWFGFKLINNGGNYRSRYDSMKKILSENI